MVDAWENGIVSFKEDVTRKLGSFCRGFEIDRSQVDRIGAGNG